MGYYTKLASAIYNDVVSGLRGYTSTPTISLDQLEDDIVDERLQIIKEYSLKGIIPKKDLLMSINCIPIDCKDKMNCRCSILKGTPQAHFEIPQIISDFSDNIQYIGSIDKQTPFIYYTDPIAASYHNYRTRGKGRPYVYIDTTPNENNLFDVWLYNAPLLKYVTVIAVFKDMRQLQDLGCCDDLEINNISYIDNEIKRRLTEKKLRFYKLGATPITPNDQSPK